ncbi:PQQ-binding-like beta-propeller repeat protein [Candidatus Micrarchaeota archaeon]|nr:PQQ-binding-like beta-propeller repeat protein [Candidatus Micrarchaeota archaeon]
MEYGGGNPSFNSILGGYNDATIEFWVKPSSYPASTTPFILLQSAFSLGFNSNGNISVSFGSDTVSSVSIIPIDNWTHVVATKDNGVASIYINGNLDSTYAITDTSIPFSAANLLIAYDGGTAYYNGTLDEAIVYRRALSASEVQQHYYSNFYKYDTNNWQFYSNESGLVDGSYTYFACANDTSGNENCTTTRTLTILPTVNGSSETDNLSEWRMFGRYLNHTSYDGVSFPILSGLNNATFTTGNLVRSSPIIANGYVYVTSNDGNIYQLNASNISSNISILSIGASGLSSPIATNNYVYVASVDSGQVLQLNASNISQQFSSFGTGYNIDGSPTLANGSLYIGNQGGTIYQLNASNLSNSFNYNTLGGYSVRSSPAIANGYVYVSYVTNYQLDSSNISQTITTGGSDDYNSLFVVNGSVYLD